MKGIVTTVLTTWLCLSGGIALAHHSVAVNFDNSKNLEITGRVKDVDIRNPHSQITPEVTAPDGSVTEWFIEWSDRNALIRRRVPFDRIRVGDTLTINASPSRRLEHVGYLVIETVGQRAGVLDTLGVPGLYQSDQMRTVERFVPEANRMRVIVTHDDPVYFGQPMTVTFTYERLPRGEILEWDCTPEEAGYDRFLPPPK